MLKKIAKLIDVLRTPGGLKAMFARPCSLTSFRMVRQIGLSQSAPRTIIDGGANVGQFARAAALAFPAARIHSFEPDPQVAAVLARNLADVPNLKVWQLALGDQDGQAEFHRSSNSQASSVLEASAQSNLVGRSFQTEKLTVPLARLDTLFADAGLERPILLKLDLQGYELAALRGASRLLAQIDMVLVEMPFEGDDGAPDGDEIWTAMQQAGFSLLRPLNFRRLPDGRIPQMDALFCRRPARPVVPPAASAQQSASLEGSLS